MKLFLTVTLCFLIQICFAATFYISPAGSDQNGNGSNSNPWRSLFKATSAVTEPGSIIHVMAGTYTEISRSVLAPGVSIEGEGVSSVIQSTLTEEFVAIIIARSPEGTDGNQHISNLKLDGNNRTTSWGIEIRGRKNFSIYDCMIVDFEDRGVLWGGRDDNEDLPPDQYATGNLFYNNILKNCAKYTDYGRGCLNIGGQEGMLIYNNTIEQTGRIKGTNGWPIKYWNGGFLKGCKIYNNKITKEPYDESSWDFAIELFNEYGLEIYNNRIIGCIDLNHQNKGDYPYGAYIHDNIIGPEKPHTALENGITLEFETNDVIIENNILKNLGTIINFTPREYNLISNLTIRNNVCENIGILSKKHDGFALRFGREPKSYYSIQNIQIINNRFIGSSIEKPYWGIAFLGALKGNSILIKNNALSGFSAGSLISNPGPVLDSISFIDNNLSYNGNNNQPVFYNGGPRHLNNAKNTRTHGSVFSIANLKMNLIRPVYYEIRSYEFIELVSLLSIIICVFLGFRENVYTYPLALISTVLFIFLKIDNELIGEALLNSYYIFMLIYGWMQWRKRDRRKHRITRVTASTKKEIILQVFIAGLLYLLIFTSFRYYNAFFSPDTIPWADAFITTTAFIAIGLFTRKKLECWYWWIMATLLASLLFFIKHYIFLSLFFAILVFLSVKGCYKWKRRIKIR
jgi:nicotinamide mononucleotide transporter